MVPRCCRMHKRTGGLWHFPTSEQPGVRENVRILFDGLHRWVGGIVFTKGLHVDQVRLFVVFE